MNEENGKFYRDKTWELVMSEVQDVKRELREQRVILADIKNKMGYIYGFAGAIGLTVTLIVEFVKSKFTPR